MTRATALRWSIRGSFLDYLHSLEDLEIALDGATLDDEGFAFPSSTEPLNFVGRVEITAHAGALHVVFADPAVDFGSGEALLTSGTGSGREPLARLLDAPSATDFAQGGAARDVALTMEGSVWLGAVYRPWARMDPVRITAE